MIELQSCFFLFFIVYKNGQQFLAQQISKSTKQNNADSPLLTIFLCFLVIIQFLIKLAKKFNLKGEINTNYKSTN